jgi:peptidoglycan hydrolase-like protein with peptidoglycan-binding domain
MSMNPAVRLIQLGLTSLGHSPGKADGWWGSKTDFAARNLYDEGPVISSAWAYETLQRGLEGLGHYEGRIDGNFDALTRAALKQAIDADGLPRAALVTSPEILEPVKPILAPVAHNRVLRQGSYIIDTYCLHCAAVPGTWASGKSNAEIVEAIHQMHTLPTSQGGRGWSDTAYHAITCPDGETIYARPMDRMGAGAIGYNRGVFHHLMIEVRTITTTRRPEDYFRAETLASTKAHIERISRQTPIKRLMGHREVAAKLCPGFNVIDREWTERAVA